MNKKTKPKKSRREFTKNLVIVASTPLLTTFCATPVPNGPSGVNAQGDTTDKAKVVAKALSEMVQARYGQNINKEDWPKVEAAIARNFATAEKLKQTKLKNSDEPSFTFRA